MNFEKTFCQSQLTGYGFGARTMSDKSTGGLLGNIGEFGWGGAEGSSFYINQE